MFDLLFLHEQPVDRQLHTADSPLLQQAVHNLPKQLQEIVDEHLPVSLWFKARAEII